MSAATDTLKSLKPAAKTGTNKRWVRPEQPSTGDAIDTPPSGESSEASNDKDATAETPDTNPQRKKLWVRPDSPEPSPETQVVSSTSSGSEAQSETKAEMSTDSIEDGSADNAIETASNTAASTTENTARTDED